MVETANGRIEVLGTRFVVDADDARTQAAVIRGTGPPRDRGGDAVLHAGELGTAVRGQAPRREPAPRLSHLASWAALQRRKDEGASVGPVRNGTLFARTTGRPAHAPFVSPDEFPLPLTDLTVDAVVDNQVARVALDQTFHNPEHQDLEGVYRFALPADAALSRLAMYVDGHLEESAVVERMRARRVYEDLVYHQIDPGPARVDRRRQGPAPGLPGARRRRQAHRPGLHPVAAPAVRRLHPDRAAARARPHRRPRPHEGPGQGLRALHNPLAEPRR